MKRRLQRGDRLVVATHNPGKVWEIKELIAPYGLDAVSAGDLGLAEPDETETTFEGNAAIKAVAAASASGLPALADDSGLEIAALGGAPGVYSADWAMPGKDFGRAMQRVHDALAEKDAWSGPPPAANFISVLCLAWPDGATRHFRGRVDGTLVWPPRGGNGFGYDPMFVPEGATLTFGEMEPAAKYAISHRTRAFSAFKRDCLEGIDAASQTAKIGRDLEGLEETLQLVARYPGYGEGDDERPVEQAHQWVPDLDGTGLLARRGRDRRHGAAGSGLFGHLRHQSSISLLSRAPVAGWTWASTR